MTIYKKANIIYFTGTGGTEYVAKAISKALVDRGIDARLLAIGSNEINDNYSDLMVIAYPVYAGDASEAVYQTIKNLDKVKDKPLVILSISAGGEVILNTSARSKVKRKLHSKGYRTVYEDMVVMPNNFAHPYSDIVNALLIQAADIMAISIVDKVTKGEEQIKKGRLIDIILRTSLSPFKMFSRFNGRMLKANKDCNSCGLCAKICPRDNIRMADDKPEFKWRCTLCMRCLYACPQNAIGNRLTNLVKIKQGFNIFSMIKDDIDLKTLTREDIINYTGKDGTRKYLLGIADLLNKNS